MRRKRTARDLQCVRQSYSDGGARSLLPREPCRSDIFSLPNKLGIRIRVIDGLSNNLWDEHRVNGAGYVGFGVLNLFRGLTCSILAPTNTPVSEDKVNPVAVAVPVVVVIALLAGGLAFFLLRRRRRRQAELQASVDPMSAYNPSLHPLVSTQGAASYQGTSSLAGRHLPEESYYRSSDTSPTTMAPSAVGATASNPTASRKGGHAVQTRAVDPAPPYSAD